jgi:hypothetical protein
MSAVLKLICMMFLHFVCYSRRNLLPDPSRDASTSRKYIIMAPNRNQNLGPAWASAAGPGGPPYRRYILEQDQAWMAQFRPPAFLHSCMALCSAFWRKKAVPQVTVLPSAAMAPHSFS